MITTFSNIIFADNLNGTIYTKCISCYITRVNICNSFNAFIFIVTGYVFFKLAHKESDLFFDWYLKYSLKNKNINKIKRLLRKELNLVYKKLNFINNTFVHRDFHVSNIMINKKKLGLIDSQDAIIGNPLYDVASLIDDVRIKLPQDLQNKLFKFYWQGSKYKNEKEEKLKNDFDILSVQRNLKILGIFVRLWKRDNKTNYLKYLPYTWKLIERRLKNPIFKNLNLLMQKNLPIKKLKLLKQYEN